MSTYYGTQIQNPEVGQSYEVSWNGSEGMFAVSAAAFNGASFSLQHKLGDYWVDLGEDAVLDTSSGGVIFSTSASELKVVVSGPTNPTNGFIIVEPVKQNKAL